MHIPHSITQDIRTCTKLKGYKVFSSLDLRSGYYHIGLADSAKPKSAFMLSSLGKYQFNRVPFGLAQAPAYFQKLINDVLKGCNFAMGYLDDIIIYSRTEKEHLEHLEEIFGRLRAAGLKLKLEKCSFFRKHIQYLGHLISADRIQPLPDKTGKYSKNASTQKPKGSETISWTSRLLQKICLQIRRYFESFNTPNKEVHGIQMHGNCSAFSRRSRSVFIMAACCIISGTCNITNGLVPLDTICSHEFSSTSSTSS